MKKDYPFLFSPVTVRGMTVKNRIVMMPMGTNYGEQNGEMSFLHIDYYRQRAKGGTGMIIVENANVDFPTGSNGTTQLRIDHDNYLPRLFKFTEEMHKYGTKLAVQINHAGASASSARTGVQPVSSSDVPSKDGGEIPRPLTKEEIEEIAIKYGQAAKRAQIAGFDAVEIHAGHSYLLSQFLSPIYNKRTDEFGGSVENRTRFCRMVIDEVRKQIGPMMPILLRISADELMEGGNTLEDTLEYLEYLNDEVDIFNVSCALNGSLQYQIDANYMPDGWRSYMAKAVKDKFGKPCISMGNYRDPKVVEATLERGDADFIGMGRGLIADPEWVKKVARGNEVDIRKCVSCNVGCAGNRIGSNRPIRCTVNPAVHEGDIYLNRKVVKACNVVVIGGGTAGLEAACTAAEVGCTVFLFEKSDELGGLASTIAKIPDKNRLEDFPTYLRHRASKLKNLFIFTGVEADAEMIKKYNPDLIVTATGSLPALPPITGLKENLDDNAGGKVQSVLGMIKSVPGYPEDMTGKKVVVIGGGAVGLDIVEFFAPRNAEVSVVEMMPVIGRDLDPITKVDINTKMKKYDVKQLPNTALMEVKADSFVLKSPEGEVYEAPFDYGFVCLGLKSQSALYDSVYEAFADTETVVLNIGDSQRQRRIIDGTFEGRNYVLTFLEDNGFLA